MAESQEPGSGAREPDVLVVGGGIAGLWCAHFLARAGQRVTVLERSTVGDRTACSSGNTGFLGAGGQPLAGPGAIRAGLRSVLHPDDRLALPPTLDVDRLRWLRMFRQAGTDRHVQRCVAGMLALKNRSRQLVGGLDCFTPSGMVHAYRTPAGLAKARAGIPRLTAAGVPMRELSAAELAELEPSVRFEIAGALFNPDAGFFVAPEASYELARTLASQGVDILAGARVTGFRTAAGLVTEVHTDAGVLRPREVVIAAGSWTAPVASLLDLRLPVQPVRGYTITVRVPAGTLRHPVLLAEGTVAVRPFGDRLRFGGDLALAGSRPAVARRRVRRMLATVRSHLPELTWPDELDVWTGFRPCTPDSLPLLGRLAGYANLTVAAGHGHNGMALAPAAGELVAQLLTDQAPTVDAGLFDPRRYSNGKLR